MDDELRFTATIRTDKVGSDCEFEVEVDRETWESMSTVERDEHVFGMALESGVVDFSYEDPTDD